MKADNSSFSEMARKVHALAIEKGWWDIEFHHVGRTFGDLCSLLHTEVSEAYEDYRNGYGLTEIYYEADGKPCGIPIEMADLVIRLLDNCQRFGIDIEAAIEEKHAFNQGRPYRHGGKLT